jgi:hypothetical protein
VAVTRFGQAWDFFVFIFLLILINPL